MDKCQVAPDGRHLWVEDSQTDNPGCRHCGVPAYGEVRIRGVMKTQAFTGPGINAQIVSLTRFVEEQSKVADLQRELATLRARLAERDASLVKALKRSV